MTIIRTKSMLELLEQYPEAYFTQNGLLRDDSWSTWLGTYMYKYLGKEIELDKDGFDPMGFVWHPQWVKETNNPRMDQ